MIRKLFALALAAAFLGGPAAAATVFSEDFESDVPGTVLNFNEFSQFEVAGGTVDILRDGFLGLRCNGGAGMCVDLDGSTNLPGVMTSSAFDVVGGTTYELSFWLSGNHRNPTIDTVTYGITGGLLTVIMPGPEQDDPFTKYAALFTPTEDASVSFFIGTNGGDQRGPLMDDITISSLETPAPVPLPAALPLLAAGLSALGLLRRRKRA